QDEHESHRGRTNEMPMPLGPLSRSLKQRRWLGFDGMITKKAPQVLGQLTRGGVPLGGGFGGAFEGDGFGVGGNGFFELVGSGGILEGDVAEDFRAVGDGYGRPEGEQLVERAAEGIDVGPVID